MGYCKEVVMDGGVEGEFVGCDVSEIVLMGGLSPLALDENRVAVSGSDGVSMQEQSRFPGIESGATTVPLSLPLEGEFWANLGALALLALGICLAHLFVFKSGLFC